MSDDPKRIDWRAFAAGILRPEQPRLREAVVTADALAAARIEEVRSARGTYFGSSRDVARVLANQTFVADAWEAMTQRLGADELFERSSRGLSCFVPSIPLRSLGAARRRTYGVEESVRRTSETPFDLETVVALTSAGSARVVEAEELALEACARMGEALAPSGPRVRRAAWKLIRRAWPYGYANPDWSSSLLGLVAVAGEGVDEPGTSFDDALGLMGVGASEPSTARRYAANVAAGWMQWRLGPLAAFPNALDPLLVLWGMGYVPLDVRHDLVILGCSLPDEFDRLSAKDFAERSAAAVDRYGFEQ